MKRTIAALLFLLVAAWVAGNTTALATPFYLYDSYGDNVYDANKTADNEDDDLMCWAASAANLLAWTGWGYPEGESFTDENDIFEYFQTHWTDWGGNAYYGLEWWFNGINQTQGENGWSQVDVSGGNFWPEVTLSNYYEYGYSLPDTMGNIAWLLQNGYATSLSITNGTKSHAITVWGYEYVEDLETFTSVWVTDSDDQKTDELVVYDVVYGEISTEVISEGVKETVTDYGWFLKDYNNEDGTSWYITEVQGLAAPVPEPATIVLVGLGLFGVLILKKQTTTTRKA